MKHLIILAIVLFLIIGEVKCIINAFNCNWKPIGKAEVLYTASACIGIGSIVGWIDIKDE